MSLGEGKIKWFNSDKGFGFVEQEVGDDFYLHGLDISLPTALTLSDLEKGMEVEFEPLETEYGLRAKNVELVNFKDEQEYSRPTWDEYFLNAANEIAKRSTCPRAEIGAVLVKDKKIIGHGYNGASSGLPDCREVGCDMGEDGCERSVHAEINAVLFCNEDTRGTTLFCSYSPCKNCQKMLINAGVERVVYQKEYRHSLELLDAADVETEQLKLREDE